MDNKIPPTPPIPPVPPILPVSPPAEKSKNWPKILLVIIGVLVVFGLFGNLYLLSKNQKPVTETTPAPAAATPTVDPTANWKTYTSEKDGYSLGYPPSWKIVEPSSYGQDTSLELNSEKSPFFAEFIIFVQSHCDNWNNCYKDKSKNTSVGGVPAYQEIAVENPNRQDIAADSTFLEKDGRFFLIQCAHDFNKRIQTTCSQILSTFKFLQ